MEKFNVNRVMLDHQHEAITKGIRCPNCDAISAHTYKPRKIELKPQSNEGTTESNKIFYKYILISAKCHSCNVESIWLKREIERIISTFDKDEIYDDVYEILLYPNVAPDLPKPNKDMPGNVLNIYNEACLVLQHSPRSSIALSRLAIEQLVEHLGAEGKTLDNKIGDLVSKGLPVTIQQMLDSVRVIGNNAVHPGQIEVEGNIDLAISLLTFINLIVDNQISQPKAIKSTYDLIPESYKKSIERRDKK